MNALAQSPLFWGALIAGLLVVYLLPSLIGAIRHVEGLGWLVAFNVLVPRRRVAGGHDPGLHAPPPRTARRVPAAGYYTQPPRQYW